jgi:hypothetical protein
MSGKTILLLCVSLLHLTIAGYVLRHRRDTFQSWSFALLCFAVALWSASPSIDLTDLDATPFHRTGGRAAIEGTSTV